LPFDPPKFVAAPATAVTANRGRRAPGGSPRLRARAVDSSRHPAGGVRAAGGAVAVDVHRAAGGIGGPDQRGRDVAGPRRHPPPTTRIVRDRGTARIGASPVRGTVGRPGVCGRGASTTTGPFALVRQRVAIFDDLGVPDASGGSMASSLLGEPRSTVDVDMAVQLDAETGAARLDRVGTAFYVPWRRPAKPCTPTRRST
jgi:hypothetical protein